LAWADTRRVLYGVRSIMAKSILALLANGRI
jgi:hypothetical protein